MKTAIHLGYANDPSALARLEELCSWVEARKALHPGLATIARWQDRPALNARVQDIDGTLLGYAPVTFVIDSRLEALGIEEVLTPEELAP